MKYAESIAASQQAVSSSAARFGLMLRYIATATGVFIAAVGAASVSTELPVFGLGLLALALLRRRPARLSRVVSTPA